VNTGFSALSISSGRAYTMGHLDETDMVFCFDAKTGEMLWKHSYPCKPFDDRHEGGPACTPLVDDGRVFTLSRAGDFLCLEAETGNLVWSKQLVETYDATIPLLGFTSSPLVAGDLVLVDVGKAMAFKKENGDLVWSSEKYRESYASPSAPFPYEGMPHAAFFNGTGLVILKVDDGHEAWRLPWRTVKFDTNTATPVISGGKAFISSGYDRGCALARIGSPSETAVTWRDDGARSNYNTSILWQGNLYGFDEKNLKCIDFETGHVRWSDPMVGTGSQILADGNLIILTEKGEMILAEISPDEFKEKARFQALGGRCWTNPVLANGLIYCRNSKGDVACFDARGAHGWESIDQSPPDTEPVPRVPETIIKSNPESLQVEAGKQQ
jgi:outer membrane protein assembly factor BamB